ncbi:MAG: RidA family protein [Planctomycetaceae bacterium]|nr:RidA family protein [Planctomycetaceae bacterium]
MTLPSPIIRHGAGPRWSDVVVHRGVATWVEVAEDSARDTAGQIEQVFAQIDATLASLGATRERLLQITIYLADLADAPTLNKLWDAWVVPGQAPVRACVQAGLSGRLRVEMIITAAVE